MATKKWTARKLAEALGYDPEEVRHTKKGTFKFLRGYYYKMGLTKTGFAAQVSANLLLLGISHKILEVGDTGYIPFRGGASLARQSHFWVEVQLQEEVSA